jgi:hypothetical protein
METSTDRQTCNFQTETNSSEVVVRQSNAGPALAVNSNGKVCVSGSASRRIGKTPYWTEKQQHFP